MEQATASFKLFFGDTDVRRVSLPLARFDAVVSALQTLYSADNLYHPELRIQYFDSEGDKCTVSTQVEWEEMLQQVAARPIKLYISESSLQGRYFKDGPAPEPQYFHSGNDSQPLPKDDKLLRELECQVPECLARLFPGGKILPYHLPEWLQNSGCVTLKKVDPNDNAVVDLDVDILKLFDVLHKQSLACFDAPQDLNKAKDFLYCMLCISPRNPLALYNLACAEALSGNVDASIEALTRAVKEGGYPNWKHMEQDTDLDAIRGNASYLQLIAEMKANDPDLVAEAEEKRKEAERIRMEEEKKKREEEERKKREEEEKLKREEEEKKKREEEEKLKREAEEKRKREEEEKLKREEEEKKKNGEEEKAKKIEASKYRVQLKLLKEMGFDDVDICEFLLEEAKGDVHVTLSLLLQAYPNSQGKK